MRHWLVLNNLALLDPLGSPHPSTESAGTRQHAWYASARLVFEALGIKSWLFCMLDKHSTN